MISGKAFPRLNAHNHRVTSPANTTYNCIAWTASDTEHWWQPHVFWPVQSPRGEHGIGILEQAFLALGYEECTDGSIEPGFEKVALFGSFTFWTHAARQLPSGQWTSKLGRAEDIEHDTPDDVAGGVYGDLVEFMKRPLKSQTSSLS